MLLLVILLLQAVMLLSSGSLGALALMISILITLLIFVDTFRYGNGRYIEPLDEMSWLVEGVKKEAKKADIKVPRLYLLDDYIPNAYSFGNTVVLSLGLFEILNREEILAVVAHELGHIKNHDGLVFPVIAYGRVFMIMTTIFLLFIHASPYFIPISMASLIIYEWSRARFVRLREFKADTVAVSLLDNPINLKEALEELEYYDDLMVRVKKHALPGIEPSIKRTEEDEGIQRQYWTPSVFSFPTHPTYNERIAHIMTIVESKMLR